MIKTALIRHTLTHNLFDSASIKLDILKQCVCATRFGFATALFSLFGVDGATTATGISVRLGTISLTGGGKLFD